jgi:hypothetical protein
LYARLVEAIFFEHLPFVVAWELITCVGDAGEEAELADVNVTVC